MIRRGEVFLVDFGAARGSEPAGQRPTVVVQNDVGNRHSPLVILVPVTSRGLDRVMPVEVRLDPPEGGLEKPSKVDCGMILTVDRRRLGQSLGHLSVGSMRKVDRALAISLGLPVPRVDDHG